MYIKYKNISKSSKLSSNATHNNISFQFGFIYVNDWSKSNYIINRKTNETIMNNDKNNNDYCIEYHSNINDRFKMYNKFVNHWKNVIIDNTNNSDNNNSNSNSNNINNTNKWDEFNNDFIFLLDTMNNNLSKQFNGDANRWIVLKNGKIVFKTPIFPSSKHVNLVDQWLSKQIA